LERWKINLNSSALPFRLTG